MVSGFRFPVSGSGVSGTGFRVKGKITINGLCFKV